MKYAFFLDIDGTLIFEGKIPDKNTKAIEKARAAGHYVFINTGRSKALVQPIITSSMELDGFVTSLGAYIEVGGIVIHEDCVSKKILDKIYPIVIDYHPLFGGNTFRIASPERKKLSPGISDYRSLLSSEELPDNTIHKATMLGRISPEDAAIIKEDFELYQHDTYFEICPKGNSKATGIKRVVEYLNEDSIVTVAVGDSINDIPMFEAADYCAAVGNAEECVKEIADYVSCNAAIGGVGEIIEHFCMREDI